MKKIVLTLWLFLFWWLGYSSLAIIPHFMIDKKPIDQTYRTLAQENQHIKYVIVISPDHFWLIKSGQIWTIDPQCRFLEQWWIKSKVMSLSWFASVWLVWSNWICHIKDHGVFEHLQFIQKYFPDAVIVPVLVSPRKIWWYEKLVKQIIQFRSDETLIIGSVDFSHYISEKYALVHDRIAENIIKQWNTSNYSQLEVDCPACVSILTQVGKEKPQFPHLTYRDSSSTLTKTDQFTWNTSRNFYIRRDPGSSLGWQSWSIWESPGSSPGWQLWSQWVFWMAWYWDTMNTRWLGQQQNNNFSKLLAPLFQLENTALDPSFYPHRLWKWLDIVWVNRESVAGTWARCKSWGNWRNITLCSDPALLWELQKLWLTHVSIANNHIGDYWVTGALSTIQIIKNYNIKPLWTILISWLLIDESDHLTIRWQKVNLYAFDRTKYRVGTKKGCEIVWKHDWFNIVSIHRWTEYEKKPNFVQQELAETLTRCGADVILWAHPHTTQPISKVTVWKKSSITAFSLWNFIFDQPPKGLKASGWWILVYGNKKIFTGMVVEHPLRDLVKWWK